MTVTDVSNKNVTEYMFDKKKNKKMRAMKHINVKCSVCGVMKNDKSDVDISSVLAKKEELDDFYSLYMFLGYFWDMFLAFCLICLTDF